VGGWVGGWAGVCVCVGGREREPLECGLHQWITLVLSIYLLFIIFLFSICTSGLHGGVRGGGCVGGPACDLHP
jgi:hypothetical protein